MMTELTEWTTPELTVLVRNQPEEAVLQQCKNNDINPGGPGRPGDCRVNQGGQNWCQAPGQS